jgi:hypothetical protein
MMKKLAKYCTSTTVSSLPVILNTIFVYVRAQSGCCYCQARLKLDQHKNMTLHCNHNISSNKLVGNQCPYERRHRLARKIFFQQSSEYSRIANYYGPEGHMLVVWQQMKVTYDQDHTLYMQWINLYIHIYVCVYHCKPPRPLYKECHCIFVQLFNVWFQPFKAQW